MKQWIYIANWKMNITPKMATDWYTMHVDDIQKTIKENQAPCIICPSFVCIPVLNDLISPHSIQLGAQNCSVYTSGPYTGEVDAQSLSQVGCSYCIIGHYERRSLYNETDEQIAQKLQNLYAAGITPIICIGTPQKELASIYTLLADQLKLLAYVPNNQSILIAYEPAYAIGTNSIPSSAELKQIFDWVHTYVSTQASHVLPSYIYGGSVQPNTITELKLIPGIDGFLIGSASNSWQTLKEIMLR